MDNKYTLVFPLTCYNELNLAVILILILISILILITC